MSHTNREACFPAVSARFAAGDESLFGWNGAPRAWGTLAQAFSGVGRSGDLFFGSWQSRGRRAGGMFSLAWVLFAAPC